MLALRLLPPRGELGNYFEGRRTGMLISVAATSRRLPSQPLEPIARERVLNRTVDGDVLRDTARRQIYRLPALT